LRNRETTFIARSEIENADRKAKAFVEKFLNWLPLRTPNVVSQILDKDKNKIIPDKYLD
jgi:hypothetical protein